MGSATVMVLGVLFTWAATGAAPPKGVLAWVRFDDPAAEAYKGVRYRFLGAGELKMSIDVPPGKGRALDLLWGAKDDQRAAAIVLAGGREIPVRSGGYDGFRWLRVPLPDDEAVAEVTLRGAASEGVRAAFLAEVRLVEATSPDAAQVEVPAQSSKITVRAGPAGLTARPAPGGEAFPAMRKLWDREPAPVAAAAGADEEHFRRAEVNARRAAEALYRCRRFVEGWLAHADPKSGLIPRNLGADRDLWNGRDAGADNYPFMVLTAALTDRALFEGRMLDMLRAEQRLTSRLDRLGDHFRFSTQSFAHPKADLDRLIFDNAEYVKDGLLPLTEWLGPSPWSDRMVGLVEDIFKHAPIDTPFGKIPTTNFEVNGDLLQACARLYWFTGDQRFLEWGVRLGDYYLLGDKHPTRHAERLHLIDHGCEAVNGLAELYVAVSRAMPEKKRAYEKPLHDLYRAILDKGRNEHGLLYTWFDPKTGQHHAAVCDTWGYDYDGLYTAFLVDGTVAYRDAVRQALASLKPHYTGHRWQGGSADGYADSIEGAINLFNREPVASAGDWIDSEIRTMWAIQKGDGVIEGWHGDGNFARTSILYALWKTQGLTVRPWRQDVRIGAVRVGGELLVSLAADEAWTGKVIFDRPRHRVNLKLPMDYPRINQFPEWFTVEAGKRYTLNDGRGPARTVVGMARLEGLDVELRPGQELRLRVH